ncbi:MAG TPA: hypothetical protein VLY24_10515 [Bryobacteraceae bacterium]|nr:hypothetical protein [Bryobacteraceae bacterium]
MRTFTLFAALLAASSIPLPAQWINYPTVGFPKTPSGTPNLGAPAPRTADGKPDLSGMWEADNTLPCNPDTENCTDLRISKEFVNLGSAIEGGLPYQPWAAALMKSRRSTQGKDDPASRCLPAGVPRAVATPTVKKFIQTPGLLAILDEYNAGFRQIFTDGRPLPADPQPSWNGYSTARWDGDTLVVETNGLRDGMWIDAMGSPMSDQARVIERYHRVNYGNMEVEITMNDPKTYTAPWTVKLHYFAVINTDLLDYICLENEQDVKHLTAVAGK